MAAFNKKMIEEFGEGVHAHAASSRRSWET
jgi:hypothetical protein